MSLEARIGSLKEQHRSLDEKIEAEHSRPGSDDTEISALKKQKLALKDEITRLEAGVSADAA